MNKRIKQFFSLLLVSAMVFTGNVGTVFGAEEQNTNLVETEQIEMISEDEDVVQENAENIAANATAEKIVEEEETIIDDEIVEESSDVVTEVLHIGEDNEEFEISYDKTTQTLTYKCLEFDERNNVSGIQSILAVEPVTVDGMRYDPYMFDFPNNRPHNYKDEEYYKFLENTFGTVEKAKQTVKKIVTINVKNIDSYAFAKWTGLQSVEFDETLEGIGEYAFFGTNLKDTIVLGSNVFALAPGAFASNSPITRVEIKSDKFIREQPGSGHKKTATDYR